MHIFNYIIIALSLLLGYLLFMRFPDFDALTKNSGFPLVSIIIPARNEEHNLHLLLADIERQTYGNLEVICVDDCSDDGTKDIIMKSTAKYVNTGGLPDGWKGKTWACQTGAFSAMGDYLLFMDADVRLDESAVSRLVDQVQGNRPVSIQPYHIIVKAYENLSMFFNMIQTVATRLFIASPKDTEGMFGPVMLIPRKLFDLYDGYEPVKSMVVEDYYLGKFYQSKGVIPRLLIGGKHFSFRMYSDGMGRLIEGWTKNFSTGARATGKGMLFLIIVWITGITVLPVELFIAVSRGWTEIAIILFAAYILSSLLLMRGGRKLGNFSSYVYFLYPIPLAAFHLIFMYSLVATRILKNTSWKGRKLQD